MAATAHRPVVLGIWGLFVLVLIQGMCACVCADASLCEESQYV